MTPLTSSAREVLAQVAAGAVLRSGYVRRRESESFWLDDASPEQPTVDRRIVAGLLKRRLLVRKGALSAGRFELTAAGREAAEVKT